jgi:hypothetical protein
VLELIDSSVLKKSFTFLVSAIQNISKFVCTLQCHLMATGLAVNEQELLLHVKLIYQYPISNQNTPNCSSQKKALNIGMTASTNDAFKSGQQFLAVYNLDQQISR